MNNFSRLQILKKLVHYESVYNLFFFLKRTINFSFYFMCRVIDTSKASEVQTVLFRVEVLSLRIMISIIWWIQWKVQYHLHFGGFGMFINNITRTQKLRRRETSSLINLAWVFFFFFFEWLFNARLPINFALLQINY